MIVRVLSFFLLAMCAMAIIIVFVLSTPISTAQVGVSGFSILLVSVTVQA